MFYYITSIRTEIDGTKRRMSLCEANNPDQACVEHVEFWRTVESILKVELAVWSEEQGCWVIARTGEFPKGWCNE